MGFYRTRERFASEIPDEIIVGFVLSREYVSFVELQEFLDAAGYATRGEWAVTLGRFDRVVLWPAVSEALLRSLQRLIAARRLFFHPACVTTYAIDGAVPSLPLASSIRVKTDSWLPAVLCSFPCRKAGAA